MTAGVGQSDGVTDERWARVKAVFGDALERPAAERPAFVAAACGDDAALRREVESLLASHDGTDAFLRQPLGRLTETAEREAPAPRVVAGRYAIEREIGRGGMGVVYLARDGRDGGAQDGGAVAVKMLRADVASAINVERFMREARLAAACRHPRILPLLDVGAADGHPYLVTPWVDGESLGQRLARERPLPVEQALAITGQIAEALGHAHALGVLHRDVTPGNILLSAEGAVLADFGIARAVLEADAERLTSTGLVVGTPEYMSPEQASGDRHLDARSDLYALASVAYEMLAGVTPFRGPTAQSVIAQKMGHEPVGVRQLRPSVPGHVAAALARALTPVPTDRFASVAAFADALVGAGAPPSGFPPAQQPARRRARVPRPARIALAAAAGFGPLAYGLHRAGGTATDDGPAPRAIRVALVPAVRGRPAGSAAPDATLNGVVTALRLFDGVSGVALPALPAAAAGDEQASAARVARANGARYAAILSAPGGPGTDLAVEVVDARRGQRIATLRAAAGAGATPDQASGDVVIGILRAIAPRDSAFPSAYRSVLQASSSSQAIIKLVEGQQEFALGNVTGARAAYDLSLRADSACLLASYRLSVLEAWDFRFDAAYDVADAALRRAAGRDDVGARLLRAQRLFAMRYADSAIAAFGRTVADDPANVDGWYGLGQALYFLGWVTGDSVASARPALERLLALAPSFAPVHGQLVDAALATGDTAAARAALGGVAVTLPWRRPKELLVQYASARPAARDSVLNTWTGESEFTYSELVLQLARTMRDPAAADRVAQMMLSPRLSPAARRRGVQYRLALAGVRRNGAGPRPAFDGAGAAFDEWVGAAALAGSAPALRPALRAAAQRAVPAALTAESLADPSSPAAQAIEFLVQDALDDVTGARARDVEPVVRAARPLVRPANPLWAGWRASLDARRALTRGDTSAAVALLRRATGRVAEPYAAFSPLASLPAQRRLLLALSSRGGRPSAEAGLVASSFRRSWAIADDLYAGR